MTTLVLQKLVFDWSHDHTTNSKSALRNDLNVSWALHLVMQVHPLKGRLPTSSALEAT